VQASAMGVDRRPGLDGADVQRHPPVLCCRGIFRIPAGRPIISAGLPKCPVAMATVSGRPSTTPYPLCAQTRITTRIRRHTRPMRCHLVRGFRGHAGHGFSCGGPEHARNFVSRVYRPDEPDQVEAYFAVGGSLAALVFVLSVVSVPLMIDKGATPGRPWPPACTRRSAIFRP